MTNSSALTVDEPPKGYPQAWSQDAILRDGATIRIRPIAPQDRDALQEMVRGMSHETSYQRFFRVKKELFPDELDQFTVLDYETVTSGKTQDVFQSGREDEPLDVFGSKGE